jgi:hypothetical protein
MKSRASILPYLTLEDRLYKKSTNIFLGYQPKYTCAYAEAGKY